MGSEASERRNEESVVGEEGRDGWKAASSAMDTKELRYVEDATESVREKRESRRVWHDSLDSKKVRHPVKLAPECCDAVETRRTRWDERGPS